jgi:protein tyrosine phosphatase (PTP) superfamily phosphohydrolase (DUF442 family)
MNSCKQMANFVFSVIAALFLVGIASSGACGTTLPEAALPENYHGLSRRIYSGGEPKGEATFAELAQRGIKTIISVDGARPERTNAEKYGLRYVHLPIGYDGVPPQTIAALAQVLRETQGGILVHCHHGKHRGPAAAAIACMIEGSLAKDAALEFLRTAGTSPDYAGLWRDVRNFAGVPADATVPPLKSAVEVEPFVAAMVSMDRALDDLLEAGMKPTRKPLNPHASAPTLPHEQATLLVEGFRESLRHAPARQEGAADFQKRLQTALGTTERILEVTRQRNLERLPSLLNELKSDCRDCHQKFRD